MRSLAQHSLILSVFLFLLFTIPAAAASHCEFRLGFAALRDLIGHEVVGECLENEHYNAIGDSNQQTTGGLMAWRKADNWTAFTDGYRTWINGPNGLIMRLNTERFEWEADYAPGGQVATPIPQPTATPTLRPTPVPPSPTPAAPSAGHGLTLATGNLGASLGTPASIEHVVVSDGVGTTVSGFVPDATRYVLATNIFNDDPGSGNRYYMIIVTVLNASEEIASVNTFDFKLIGSKRTTYDFSDDCGVIKDELDVELYPDGVDSGTVCFEVPMNERGFVLIYAPLFSFDESRRRYIRLPDYCPNKEVVEGIEICKPDYLAK